MKFEPKKVQHSINKAFLKEPVERKRFNVFKEALGKLLSDIEQSEEANEQEEHFKNLLPPSNCLLRINSINIGPLS